MAAGAIRALTPARVFLVGAGPGDPDLLTLRALQVLQDADIVFYDELVTDAVLDRVRRDAKRVFVGKQRGEPGIGQDEINRRLVEAARAGRKVVRLKGGDAFVFGRGGEEIERLREHSMPVVIVPGITAALGCAAEAELPLTFRNEATRLSFVTAHRADEAAARRLVRARRQADHGRGLYGPRLGRGGARRADRRPGAIQRRLLPCWRAARGPIRARRSDVSTIFPSSPRRPARGRRCSSIGEVVAHSAPWREALEFLNAQVAA